MALQSTYTEVMPAGSPGLVANGETWNGITRTADGTIAFGLPVIRTGDHTCILASQETLQSAAAAGTPAPAGATITASPTVGTGAKKGTYHAICIVGGSATASKWAVEDSDGVEVGIATGNTAFTGGGLTFTITDSGTDPIVGEAFDIVVTATVGTADLDVLGIAIRDVALGHSATPDSYAQYDSVGILTQGVIWVTAGATVAAGDDVYWSPSTSKYTKAASDLRVPGFKFDSAGADAGLVKIAKR